MCGRAAFCQFQVLEVTFFVRSFRICFRMAAGKLENADTLCEKKEKQRIAPLLQTID